MEAKCLVNDMRLRLNVNHQDGDWLLVSRVEVHLEMTIDSHYVTEFALVASTQVLVATELVAKG